MAKIVIAGGSGFLGHALSKYLISKGDSLTLLTRKIDSGNPVRSVEWDGQTQGEWVATLEEADAVINLAGAPITLPWNETNRQLIINSRVKSTLAIGLAICNAKNPPATWINASATGYYGDRGDEILPESASFGTGFLAEVCKQWEDSVDAHPTPKTRKIKLRTGVVLGLNGGALAPLVGLTKSFLGGPAGDGKQYVPWIHLQDHVRLVRWCALGDVSGPINACAPNPVTNAQLMAELRATLGRPMAPPAPAFALKLLSKIGGPDAHVLLDSTRAIPQAALQGGFDFVYPTLGPALTSLLKG